ncbi:acyl-CoA dehydrogenase family protein [Chloroflexota bacterium]
MNFKFSKEEKKFCEEVRNFLLAESELVEDVRIEIDVGAGQGPRSKELIRKLGAKSYLTPSWPEKYGGLDKPPIYTFIAHEEIAYHVGALIIAGVTFSGPSILLFGSEQQKEKYLLKIARGEILFALGYTEPQAGSDLAALEMHAVREGDYYIINGQKTFNTAPHFSDYHWLAARTDPSVSKHKGISLFIVDLKSPGITIRPMTGVGKFMVNEVFYDDVKVPVENRVGEENRGWYYISTALSLERTWLVGIAQRDFDELLAYAKGTSKDERPIADDPLIRQELAQLAIRIEMSHLLALRVTCLRDKGIVADYEAAMSKMFGSEAQYGVENEWMKILSLYGTLQMGSASAPFDGRVGQWYFRAVRDLLTRGTNEIMKAIIARRKLGLP